jgi:hypothetical protein
VLLGGVCINAHARPGGGATKLRVRAA